MSIFYSYQRDPRLARKVAALTAFSGATEQEAAFVPATLSAQAVAAMTDPALITPLLDAALELESNRLQRATTTVLKRADTLASVGVWDAATMNVATLSTGRRNPTRRFALADTSIADETTVWDQAPDGSEEFAVAFADPMGLTDEIPGGYPVSGSVGWTWTGGGGVATAVILSGGGNYAGGGYVRRVSHATAVPAGVLASPARVVAYQQVAGQAGRMFTASAHVRLSTGPRPSTLTLRLRLNLGAAGTLYGPTVTLTETTVGAIWQRVSFTGRLPNPVANGVVTSMSLEVEVFASTSLTIFDLDACEAYAGPDRGVLMGRNAAIPTIAGSTVLAVIEQTWTGTRQVNRVELSGERRLGRINSARVDVLDDVTGTWVTVGAEGGPGKLAVIFPTTYVARGVRVYVEESSGGPGGRVWVTEVDPMLVSDVTTDLVSAGIKWAREAQNATSPFGNYQAATADVTLDNSSGIYTPARNASLGAGHRLELAVGARWTNLVANPRADIDLGGSILAYQTTPGGGSGYTPAVRSYPCPPGAPAATAIAQTLLTGPANAYLGNRADGIAGRTYRASVYVRLDSTDPSAIVTLVTRGVSPNGSTSYGTLTPDVGPVVPGQGWRKLTTATFVFPNTTAGGGVIYLEPRLDTFTAGAVSTAYATCFELVEIDVATGLPVSTDELIPAGVFYADPWAAPSDSAVVTISAADRLGRNAANKIDEEVRAGVTIDLLVRDLALTYLDVDDDQVAVSSSVGSYAIPYAYPSGDLGSYFADLAKAGLGTLYLDPAERLVLSPIGTATSAPVAEIRADNALVRSSKPNGVDTTVSVVTATAAPLALDVVTDLWVAPAGGVTVAPSSSRTIFVPYSSAPAVNVFLTGVTADGAYTITASAFYADHALITVQNPNAGVLTILTATVRGTPLVETPLAAQVVDAASRARFGARELAVEARLVQTQTQLDLVASVLLDAFRGLDSTGTRRLPIVQLDSLGLLHVDLDDVVTVFDPAVGVGADYLLTSRELTFESGHLLTLNATGIPAPTVTFAVADTSLADDVYVAGY